MRTTFSFGRSECGPLRGNAFIERYLGYSPDNGDGSLEAIILIALVTGVAGIALGFFREHRVRK
jgi:hypothetical protein